MFGTIRRHQTWLWIIIAGITIFTFVIWGPTNYSRAGRGSGGGGSGSFGEIGGKRITRDEYDGARREVELDAFLRTGRKIEDSAMIEFETYRQLFFMRKQEDLGIKVSTDAANATSEFHLPLPQDRLLTLL